MRPTRYLGWALVLIGSGACASAGQRELWAKADWLCRHQVTRVQAVEFARTDLEIGFYVAPHTLAAPRPCEGDLGDVSKCSQEALGWAVMREGARFATCRAQGVEIDGDRARVVFEGVAEVDLERVDPNLRSVMRGGRATIDGELRFVHTAAGWRATFADESGRK